MPVIWFSSGAATVCSSVSAEAPGYTACTVTTGGAISGYCAIGRLRIAARPAITMKTERTAAKMGRSMKRRENIVGSLFLRHGEGRLAAFLTLAHPLRRGLRFGAAFRRREGP